MLHECVGLCLGALPQKFALHTILLGETTEALLLAKMVKTGDIKEQLRQGYFMLMSSTSHCPNFTTRFGHGAEDDGKIPYSRVIKRMRL